MASVDAFLVVGFCLLFLLLMVINIYVMAYYQHPEDQNNSYYAKILIFISFMLCTFAVTLIPVDVANNAGDPSCDSSSSSGNISCGGINMLVVYESLFCIICFVIMGLIPFAIFYYESYSVEQSHPKDKTANQGAVGNSLYDRFVSSLLYDIIVLFAFAVTVIPLYFTSSVTNIPVTEYSYTVDAIAESTYTSRSGSTPFEIIPQSLPMSAFRVTNVQSVDHITYIVTFPVYVIALLGWIGWWGFSVFVGVGLASLPFDLILSFIHRPKRLPPDEYAVREQELQERTNDLLDISRLMKKDHRIFMESSATRYEKRQRLVSSQLEVNRLAQMVFILEQDITAFKLCKTYLTNNYNPIIPYLKLLAGSLLACVSLLWILHIILYMLSDPYVTIFLNAYLIAFDTFFPMFGTVSYGLLSLYLLFCTILGCFKIGLRFLCIKIHPMRLHATYTNSFLFNVAIMLICTIPIVHFCTLAFGIYTRYSDAFLLFGVQIQFLQFYSIFYESNVFPYIMVLSAGMALIYLFWKPADKSISPEEFKQLLYRRGAAPIASDDTISGVNPGKRK